MDLKKRLSDELAHLETVRGDLEVRFHLAKADAKDELSALRTKLDDARYKLRNELETLSESSVATTSAAAEQLGTELKASYERLKALLK